MSPFDTQLEENGNKSLTFSKVCLMLREPTLYSKVTALRARSSFSTSWRRRDATRRDEARWGGGRQMEKKKNQREWEWLRWRKRVVGIIIIIIIWSSFPDAILPLLPAFSSRQSVERCGPFGRRQMCLKVLRRSSNTPVSTAVLQYVHLKSGKPRPRWCIGHLPAELDMCLARPVNAGGGRVHEPTKPQHNCYY